MRKAATAFHILMWVMFGFSALWQVAAVSAILFSQFNNQNFTTYNVVPLVVFIVLMLASLVLFEVMKKRRYIAVIVSFAAAIALFVIALELKRLIPVTVDSASVTGTTGLTTWKLIYRHISMSFVPFFMLPTWLFDQSARRQEMEARELQKKEHLDLSGGPLFKDTDTVKAGNASADKKNRKARG